MENQYSTLQVLAEAAKPLPKPSAYFFTPREMILRCTYDWATIYSHLLLLQTEQLVEIRNADTIQFAITEAGLQKIKGLETEAADLLLSLKKIKIS